MGGRGVNTKKDNRQISIADYSLRMDVEEIHSKNENLRAKYREEMENVGASGMGTTNKGGRVSLLKKCACCGQYTLHVYSDFEICPVCGWIDDPDQNRDIYSLDGKNPVCLAIAREQWKAKVQKV